MDKFIENANVPQTQIKSVIYGSRYRCRLEKTFFDWNIESILFPENTAVSEQVKGHIDLMCCHIGKNKIIVPQSIKEKAEKIMNNKEIEIYCGLDIASPQYPYEAAYNVAIIDNYFFCNSQIIDPVLFKLLINSKLKLIDCKQGYSRCAIAIIDKKSLITSDRAIFKKATEIGFDCLLIEPGYISLEGYPYGFIGGCCVKINPKCIAFTGTFDHHPDASKIKKFIHNKNIEIKYMTKEKIFDVGSIIPLTEQ